MLCAARQRKRPCDSQPTWPSVFIIKKGESSSPQKGLPSERSPRGGASTPKSRGYFSPNLTATLCYRQVHCGIYFEAVCRPSFKDSFEDCSFQLHAQWLKAWTATFFCKGRTGESVSLSRPHSICRRYWPWPYTAVAATDRLRSERPGRVPTGPLNSWTRNLESCVIFIHCEILL